ncbi:helix-turn-helix domain-containing protein [Streptomyces sp. NPDC002932]|uniref:helix-turn-helix domain-containing protein n=1 Tax=Streptomyces sp. NPDC002932 TaxID=3364672 RepID=UPI0036A4A17D
MPIRSHPVPQRPARSGPAIDAARATRCTESVRDMAEDFTVLSEALMHSTYGVAAPTAELLEIVIALERLAQEAIPALVVRQRSQGESLSELAPLLNLTPNRLRKKYVPQAVDRSLASRRRPRRAAPSTQPADAAPNPKHLLREPRQRLACALTRMRALSRVSQRALAAAMNVDPSYVSRLLSGERDVSWRHVKIITEACDGNIDLMRPLWEAAAGVDPDGTNPARYLRTYLWALHYAAGAPTDARILASTQRTITAAELHQAFEGPGVPDWGVVAQLVTVLQSLPDVARPLWRQARSKAEASSFRAEAFG